MISIVGCKLLQKIGEGELGVVYKAHLLSDDRYVAVKVLKGVHSEFSPAVTRFNLQAAAATNLRHPNIVEGYKTGKTEQTSYFIMDLGRGYSLADWMQRKGRIPEPDALLTIRSVAEGLCYAWDTAGYIHADIKPSNILIDADGVVKISDFSGLRYDVSDPLWQTLEEAGIGVPPYLSPEQARGVEGLDLRSDMYSLGALLYHMVTGKEPFAEKKRAEAIESQKYGYLDYPLELNPGISEGACQLLRKMMAKNRADRHASWSDLLVDIDLALSGKKAVELPQDVLSTIPPWPKYGVNPYKKSSNDVNHAIASSAASGNGSKRDAFLQKRQMRRGIVYLSILVFVLLLLNIIAITNPRVLQETRRVIAGVFSGAKEPRLRPLGDIGREDGQRDLSAGERRNVVPEETDGWGRPVETADAAGGNLIEHESVLHAGYPASIADNLLDEQDTEEEMPTVGSGPEETSDRTVAFMDYITVMAPTLTQSRTRQYESAMRNMIAWIEEHPTHPYRSQMAREVRRLAQAKAVFDALEGSRDRLIGRTLTGGERLVGQITALGEGNITMYRKLGSGNARQSFPLRDLPNHDLGLLIHISDPENYITKYAALLLSQGIFSDALTLINRAEEEGRDVADLISWAEDWRVLGMNVRAYISLEAVRQALQDDELDSAAERLQHAQIRFASTDVFRWALNDDVERLKNTISESRRANLGTQFASPGDGSTTRLELTPVTDLSISDLNGRMVQYDGQVVRLIFNFRERITEISADVAQTRLSDGESFANVRFSPSAARWVREVPLWDLRAAAQQVYGRVNAAENTVLLLGSVRQTSGSSAIYLWR